ncbi:MBL fold metallo-hydrolase [Scleromatobacter humisilvae]|uniref:MBL fold metallo-hydrolase n=1 Tax=Scleromatobacter humisilvae TaxID=2897159 RepID=A0A9X1YK88_9BURK|nr:MBL fold metallo-hydrolase [Scleromatobacter humisilvae]MCK9687854.1 MBL fold metallo-hydrolase [Scleromatobacter humisilvae]
MADALPSFVEPLGNGLWAIDTGFHRDRFDAAYLVADGGRAAFVDTGTAFAVPRLLAALDALGLPRSAVDFVIATHVHLDHAGGVGQLMQALRGAQLVVHPRGARHMIDPTALWQGALAVYGAAQMAQAYGSLVPVPAERVRVTADGETISLAGRPLLFAHTPGHALHHHCIWDARSQGWFTGDNFGMAYPEFDVGGRAFIFPTTTPVQFDPEAMRASIARLTAPSPRQMFLTHYSRITGVADCAERLLAMIEATVAVALARRDAPDRLQAITSGLMALYGDGARAFGVALPDDQIAALLRDDAALNAAGLIAWLDRPSRASATPANA